MDTLTWVIAHQGRTATICEDGTVESEDAELATLLRQRLEEPLTVFRHGTVAALEGSPPEAIELHPGDGRYVVARVRALCAREPAFRIVGSEWR